MKLGPIELILIIPFLAVYFLPTIIASARRKSNWILIFLLNLLLGWTFVGWIVSLILACLSNNSQSVVVHNHVNQSNKTHVTNHSLDEKLAHLQKMKDLVDSGVLSQSEFEAQKTKILNS